MQLTLPFYLTFSHKLSILEKNSEYWNDLFIKTRFVEKNERYGWKYKALRAMLKEKYKECQHCGSNEYLETHHKNGPKNHPDNLIILCHSCHEEAEGHRFLNMALYNKQNSLKIKNEA